MALFDNITVDATAEVVEQEVRKSQSWIKDSGAYTVEVTGFRFKESTGGANGFVIDLQTADGAKITTEDWFTTKAGGTTYVGKQDGKTHDLPGMARLKSISRTLTGDPLAFMKTERKVVPIYDFNAKTEVDTEVDVFVATIGKTVEILVQRTAEDKTKLNPATGKYEPINEVKLFNDIVAWVDPVSHKTFSENAAGLETKTYATFKSNIESTPIKDKRKVSSSSNMNAKPEEKKEPSEIAKNAFS